MPTTTRADLMLLMTTAFWGLTFPLMQIIVGSISPEAFVLARFIIAMIVFSPFVFSQLFQTTRMTLMVGIILGLLNSVIYLCQTIGLQTIDAPRAAFITGASVVLVPFLLPLFRLGKPAWFDIFFAFLCVLGLFILTGASLGGFHPGDFWVCTGAVFNAFSIVLIQWATPKSLVQPRLLAFYAILFTLPIPFFLGMHQHFAPLLEPSVLGVVLFCGVFATSIAFFMQTKYQQHTSAPKAALIYALEPVFAVIFAWVVSGTGLSNNMVLGGGLMLLSIALPDSIKLYRMKKISFLQSGDFLVRQVKKLKSPRV